MDPCQTAAAVPGGAQLQRAAALAVLPATSAAASVAAAVLSGALRLPGPKAAAHAGAGFLRATRAAAGAWLGPVPAEDRGIPARARAAAADPGAAVPPQCAEGVWVCQQGGGRYQMIALPTCLLHTLF
ncbi:hypothetical protein PG991_001811 [Apiospora marii]|uniref:Uncharacterized protein n=1 Tax=Apiospora marii TaxID=335849 RepID=A0ABR1SN27_9PEZI